MHFVFIYLILKVCINNKLLSFYALTLQVIIKCCRYELAEYNTDYFTFFIHLSQYLSIRITLSSTLNKASCVAVSPQCAQNFAFPLGSSNGLTTVKTFFILHSPKIHPQKIGCYLIIGGEC
jgi:hypothetical protein